MGLLWISSEKDGQRVIWGGGGGLNFPIRDFLGGKIWQGVGIFNRWLDLSRFFFPQIHGSARMFRVVILHYYCYC